MIAESKSSMRAHVLACRDALSDAERARKSRRIADRVMALPEFHSAQVPLLFASFGCEVDTWPLIRAALQVGKRVVLPAVSNSPRCLRLRRVDDSEVDLQPGVWGIMEPREHCVEVASSELDFVLVPGVAFDARGGRLGYGGGYYDWLLAQLGAQKPSVPLVAVAFELQIVPVVPTDTHDLPVPIIVTEERIITCCAGEKPVAASGAGHEP